MAVVVKGLLMDGAAFIASERVFFLQSGSLVSLDVGVLYGTVDPRKKPDVHVRAEDVPYQLIGADPCPQDSSVIACLGCDKEERNFVLILKIDLQEGIAASRVVAQHPVNGHASDVLWSPTGSHLCVVSTYERERTHDNNCSHSAVTLFKMFLGQEAKSKGNANNRKRRQTTNCCLTCILEVEKSFPVFLNGNGSGNDCLALYNGHSKGGPTVEIWDLACNGAVPEVTLPISDCTVISLHAAAGQLIILCCQQRETWPFVRIIPIHGGDGKIRVGAPADFLNPNYLLFPRDGYVDETVPQWGNMDASLAILLHEGRTFCIRPDSRVFNMASLPPLNPRKPTQLLLNKSAETITVLQWEGRNRCTATSVTPKENTTHDGQSQGPRNVSEIEPKQEREASRSSLADQKLPDLAAATAKEAETSKASSSGVVVVEPCDTPNENAMFDTAKPSIEERQPVTADTQRAVSWLGSTKRALEWACLRLTGNAFSSAKQDETEVQSQAAQLSDEQLQQELPPENVDAMMQRERAATLAENEELKRQNAEWTRNEMEKLEKLHQCELENQKAKYEQSVAEARNELRAAQKQTETDAKLKKVHQCEMESQKAKYEQSVSEARNEVLRAAQKQTETDTLLAEAHKCSSRLESELRQRDEKLKRVEAKLQTQLTTVTTLQKENRKLIRENSQLKTNVQQLGAEVAKYRQENAELQKKNTDETQNVLAQLQGLLPAVQKAVNDSTEAFEVRVEEAAKGRTNELQQAVHKLEDESKKIKEETFRSLITNIVKGVGTGLNARNQSQQPEFAFEVNECIFRNAPSIALFREGMKKFNVPELLAVLKNQQAYSLAFHGTPDRNNVLSIFHDGWDPSRRNTNGQQYGPGEYFATEINTPLRYQQLNGAVVIAILLPGTFQRAQNGYCVVNNPTDRSAAFCLPIGAVFSCIPQQQQLSSHPIGICQKCRTQAGKKTQKNSRQSPKRWCFLC